LLRGESLELLSRELGVTAPTLTAWQETFLASGAQGFAKKTPAQEAEAKRLNTNPSLTKCRKKLVKSAY
jgi:transposase-like protein